jgi:hypothetical protein
LLRSALSSGVREVTAEEDRDFLETKPRWNARSANSKIDKKVRSPENVATMSDGGSRADSRHRSFAGLSISHYSRVVKLQQGDFSVNGLMPLSETRSS